MSLKVENLNFSHKQKKVLDNICFEIQDGDIVALLGANGAGKTTLLKSIVQILQNTSVSYNGENISNLAKNDLAKLMAFVPQSATSSNATVFESILLGRVPHVGLFNSSEDLQKTARVIEALGLSHISQKPTNQISGGEFQKTQIARAINQEPKILILDEPSNNLDIANQHKTLHIVEHIALEKKMSIIMSIHDINLAIHYANKFLFLSEGKVKAFGGLECINEELMWEVYGVKSEIIDHKGVPFIVPMHSSKYHLQSHAHPHDAHDHITI